MRLISIFWTINFCNIFIKFNFRRHNNFWICKPLNNFAQACILNLFVNFF